jgi:hypothetical protein
MRAGIGLRTGVKFWKLKQIGQNILLKQADENILSSEYDFPGENKLSVIN